MFSQKILGAASQLNWEDYYSPTDGTVSYDLWTQRRRHHHRGRLPDSFTLEWTPLHGLGRELYPQGGCGSSEEGRPS